jgi:PAS domain S-box-containing protein
MLEASPTITWTLDRDLRFTSSVGAGLAALGLKPDEVVGRSLFQYFGTDDPNFLPIAASRRALEGESVTYETAFGGHLFLSRVVPLRAPSGEVVGCLGSSQDVTDLRRTEEALRQRAEFEQLLLSVAGAFVRAPAAGLAAEVRRALERLAALLDADRVALWVLSEDGHRVVRRAEWTAEGAAESPAGPLSARDFNWSLEHGRAGHAA